MSATPLHAVTGAFGYSGKYIARRLLDSGQRVITLTNSIDRANAFGGQIPAFPFNFDRPGELARALDGVEVLYNTYWVRFNHHPRVAARRRPRDLLAAVSVGGATPYTMVVVVK